MKFKEIVAPTVKELFIHQIESLILTGQLQVGERLPTEREIAADMKISKTVVHEGLTELKRLGFLELASPRGLQVANYAKTGNIDTLLAIMNFNGGRMDQKTAESLLDVRAYLECPALEALAAHHSEQDIQQLLKAQQDVVNASEGSLDDFALAFLMYHREIAYLSGNQIIPLIFNAFGQPILFFWRDFIHIVGKENALKELFSYTEAIQNGDVHAVSSHLKDSIEAYKKAVKN